MKDEMVNIAELRQHPEYIRHRKNTEYISELAAVLGESGWIFPAVELQPVASTDKAYQEEGIRYYILDGTNRIAAAVEAEYSKKIPAKIHPPMTVFDSIALQVKLNNSHGLRLSVSDQTAAIKRMSELGMEGKKIAKETGISASSVSRIVKDKQRTTTNGKAGGNTRPERVRRPFNYDAWLKTLGRVLKGYKEYGPKIRKAGFPGVCGTALDNITEELSK
jgi:hypothetical protein